MSDEIKVLEEIISRGGVFDYYPQYKGDKALFSVKVYNEDFHLDEITGLSLIEVIGRYQAWNSRTGES